MGEGEKNTSHTAQQHCWYLAAELTRCIWRSGRKYWGAGEGGEGGRWVGGGGGDGGRFGTEKTDEAKRRPGRQLPSGREQDVS